MRLGGFADVENDFVLKRHDDRECERSLRTRRVKPDKMVYLECRTKRFLRWSKMVHKAATAAAIQKAVQTIYVMTKGAKNLCVRSD